jgi:hypothetical protein
MKRLHCLPSALYSEDNAKLLEFLEIDEWVRQAIEKEQSSETLWQTKQ